MGLLKLIACFVFLVPWFHACVPIEIQFIGYCILCASWIAHSEKE